MIQIIIVLCPIQKSVIKKLSAVCYQLKAKKAVPLSHSRLYEFVVESSACVLEPSVTVKQRVGVWIRLNSFVKGFVNEWIIIVLT